MAKPLIKAIALDLGSTSVKAALLDQHGELCHITALPAPALHVDGGTFESDALAYAATAEQVLNACRQHAGDALPLGLCSQRSSFLLWHAATGLPVTPLISWQDNRGAASCMALHGQEALIHELTGLRLTPYYFAPKLRIVLQQNPAWRAQLASGELLVGTLDTFLIWRWSNGQHHITDASMAARTLLMDIGTQQWSAQLCNLFDIPPGALPAITPSAGLALQLQHGLTLQASMGDQSAALIASMDAGSSDVLVNLGTGGFVMRYLNAPSPPSGYLHTLVYQESRLKTHIAIEGTLNSIAAALAAYPAAACRVEELAQLDIYCLSEPSGLGAPYFRNDLGLIFSAAIDELTPRQIAALLLEGIIFRVARILEEFQAGADTGNVYLPDVYLSGGLSELNCLQQGIALCTPCAVFHLQQHDTSLQGAALLAAGIPPGSHRQAERVLVSHDGKALQEKYQRWKVWLDGLL